MATSRGILTSGYGKPRYIEMAKTMARSLDIHQVKTPRAVITDSDDPELVNLFDAVIPLDKSRGSGVRQKLWLGDYSPYDQTLFIDSDCIVVGSTDWLWDFFAPVSFGVIGTQRAAAPLWFDRKVLPSHLQFETYPVFNGGVYYFVQDVLAKAVFEDAKEVADHYVEWGLSPFRGGINEEPCLSLALAKNGLTASLDTAGRSMYTPIGIVGPMEIDVLQGFCRFNKEGTIVEPTIVHFAGHLADEWIYKRECLKIRLHRHNKMIDSGISFVVNLCYSLRHSAGRVKHALKSGRAPAKVSRD